MGQVLIIDDDEHITRLLETHLTDEGHQVTVTHDGEDGMAQAEKNHFDLIMLDVFLPDATGYQMCNRLRKNPSTKTTPIIMMTGAARFPNQQMYGRQRGANEYIFKPFDIVEVGQLVHKYLQPSTNGTVPIIPTPENIAALNALFKKKDQAPEIFETVKEEPPESKWNASQPLETLDAFGQPTAQQPMPKFVEKPISLIPMDEPMPEPAAKPMPIPVFNTPTPVPMSEAPDTASESSAPLTFSSSDRFIDFGMEIYTLASRLTNSRSEIYLADQLLRTALMAGARMTESRNAANRHEALLLLQQALKEIRETGHWLMLAGKTGLLKALGRTDLENTCQTLTMLLADFVHTQQKSSK